MNQEIATKLSIARSRMLLDHPFFGVLALRLQLIEDESIPTLATDGNRIIYNPQFIDQLSVELCSSAIAHEVMHCVLEHISRRIAREPRRWNQACDFAANPILKDAGLPLGAGWLYNPGYVGKSAEEIYTMLPEDDGGDDPLCDIQQPQGAFQQQGDQRYGQAGQHRTGCQAQHVAVDQRQPETGPHGSCSGRGHAVRHSRRQVWAKASSVSSLRSTAVPSAGGPGQPASGKLAPAWSRAPA